MQSKESIGGLMSSQSPQRIIINPIKMILTLTLQVIQLLYLIPNKNTFKSNTQKLGFYTFTSTAPLWPMVNVDNFYGEKDLGVMLSPQHPKFFAGRGMTSKQGVSSSLHLCSFGVTFTHLLTWSTHLVFPYWSFKFYSNFATYGQFYLGWIFFPCSFSYFQNQFYQW